MPTIPRYRPQRGDKFYTFTVSNDGTKINVPPIRRSAQTERADNIFYTLKIQYVE